MHAKTGIASRRLKPTLGLLDPENTRTMPSQVAASSGLDILSHAVESFTALPYSERPLPDRPLLRPAYQGSNPISDIWSLQALRMVAQVSGPRRGRSLRRRSSREHAAGGVLRGRRIRECGRASAPRHVVSGFGQREELSPSGLPRRPRSDSSWILGDPERARGVSLHCIGESRAASRGRAGIWAWTSRAARPPTRAAFFSERITWFMQRLKTPNGLREIGYTSSDIPALVEGTLPQHRVTKLSPRPAGPEELAKLFEESL